jgi:hypothetical protein
MLSWPSDRTPGYFLFSEIEARRRLELSLSRMDVAVAQD